ncbi:restriction endonuclease [Haliea salexigens]|uniref:restriction endonuclease n=1 Tax=Haliea salexigens TaxID=287487 RepID=UPI00040A5D25|nr:restriction endonuclease [Haliea salexigens]
MGRKKQSVLDDLMIAPWWVSPMVAAAAYIGLKYLVPIFIPDNPFFVGMKTAGPTVAPYVAILFLVPMPFAYLNGRRRRRLVDTHRRLSDIRGLSWREFEEYVAEIYRRRGYTVKENLADGPDGGVDIRLERDGKPHIVQCKQWKSNKVGVTVVRELYGVMVSEGALSASVVTTGMFTEEARHFAADKAIDLIDGAQLEGLIGQPATKHAQPTQADATVLDCPRCGSALVRRRARRGKMAGKEFWGCSSFPKCRHTQNE